MIVAGVGLALLAAAVNALSVVLLASEARRTPPRDAMHVSLLRRLAHRRRWLTGTALMGGAGLAQVVALAFAPLAVVQPTLSTSQLVLLVIARVKLGERVGRHEVFSSLAIVGGLAAVVWAAPVHSARTAPVGALVPPVAGVGGAALIAYVIGRAHPRGRISLVLGAGIAYAWADFAVKLLAGAGSSGRWLLVLAWLPAIIVVGAVAFLEENTALQHRPAVTVAPVISAVKVPVPVLMALAAGLEHWTGGPFEVAVMAAGLAIVAAGAAGLGRSEVVARVSAAPAGATSPGAAKHPSGELPSEAVDGPDGQVTSATAGASRSEPLVSSEAAAPAGSDRTP